MANIKKPSRNAKIMLEVPMDAATLCKKGTKKHFPFQETEAKCCESNEIPKTKHACVVGAHESLESSLPITSQAKEKNQ